MNDKRTKEIYSEGPPRYFLPVCVKLPIGFLGGPSGYKEVGPEYADHGPIIIEVEDWSEWGILESVQ